MLHTHVSYDSAFGIFSPRIVQCDYISSLCGSNPLLIIAIIKGSRIIVAVPPGLWVRFYLVSISEVIIFFFFHILSVILSFVSNPFYVPNGY